MAAFSAPSFAQEISEEHLKAARAAVDAINATDLYDNILPNAAVALKAELIQKNPDLESIITATVDGTTLKLAGRRADLEKEAALAYARVFSIEDLNGIATFYNRIHRRPVGRDPSSGEEIVANFGDEQFKVG